MTAPHPLSPPTKATTTAAEEVAPASFGRITAFAIGVIAIGWLGPVLDRASGNDPGEGPGMLVWILLPIGLATLARWRGGDGFGDAGLRPAYRANRRWYELSSAFYPAIMLAAAGLGLAAGHLDPVDDRAPFRFAVLAAVGLLPVTVAAVAEEFGWRGYLVPRLQAAGVSPLVNHLVVGVIWGTWHLAYLAKLWEHTDESAWTLGPRMVLGTTIAAVVYGEIRLATGSVWPAVFMHAAGNAVAGALLDGDRVLARSETMPWHISPGIEGGMVMVLTAAAGAALVMRRRRLAA